MRRQIRAALEVAATRMRPPSADAGTRRLERTATAPRCCADQMPTPASRRTARGRWRSDRSGSAAPFWPVMRPLLARRREKTMVSPASGATAESGSMPSTITSTAVAMIPSRKKPESHRTILVSRQIGALHHACLHEEQAREQMKCNQSESAICPRRAASGELSGVRRRQTRSPRGVSLDSSVSFDDAHKSAVHVRCVVWLCACGATRLINDDRQLSRCHAGTFRSRFTKKKITCQCCAAGGSS